MPNRISHVRAAALCVALTLTATAEAQTRATGSYPTRPIRLVVPYAPGGSTDAIARILQPKFAEALGQQMVIDNRPGAAGSLGRELVAKATPDGYTLIFADAPHTINVHVLRHVPYDPIRDFSPITLMASAPQALIVHPSFPAQTLKEFIAQLHAQPGKYNYGSGGTGSITHLTGELFKLATKTNLVHVPYKSIGLATADVMGTQVQAAFPTMPGIVQHVRSGRLRALAVSSTRRVSALPDLPTFEETGVNGVIVSNWFGFFGPAKLPQDIVAQLHKTVTGILHSQDVRSRLNNLSLEITTNTPSEFDTFLRAELEKWGKVVKAAGIKPE